MTLFVQFSNQSIATKCVINQWNKKNGMYMKRIREKEWYDMRTRSRFRSCPQRMRKRSKHYVNNKYVNMGKWNDPYQNNEWKNDRTQVRKLNIFLFVSFLQLLVISIYEYNEYNECEIKWYKISQIDITNHRKYNKQQRRTENCRKSK